MSEKTKKPTPTHTGPAHRLDQNVNVPKPYAEKPMVPVPVNEKQPGNGGKAGNETK